MTWQPLPAGSSGDTYEGWRLADDPVGELSRIFDVPQELLEPRSEPAESAGQPRWSDTPDPSSWTERLLECDRLLDEFGSALREQHRAPTPSVAVVHERAAWDAARALIVAVVQATSAPAGDDGAHE